MKIHEVAKHYILQWEGRRIELEAGDVVTAGPLPKDKKSRNQWFAIQDTRRHVLKPGGFEAAQKVGGLLVDYKPKKPDKVKK